MSTVTGSSATEDLFAYFFVPLPDPLGLPDGYIYEVHRQETYDDWVKRHAHDDRREWVHVSMRFWRVKNDWIFASGMADAIRRALPQVGLPPQDGKRPDVDGTIVELAVRLEAEDQPGLSNAFDEGLHLLRDFQRAYYLVRRRPIQLVSRQQMPPYVPYAVRRGMRPDDPWPDTLEIFLLNLNIPWRDADLARVELTALKDAIRTQSERRVFTPYLDLQREADIALERTGDTRNAVLLAASAAEVMLDQMLAHLLWEEGNRPEDAAQVFDGTKLVARVKREYHPRLGGVWSLDGAGALRDWHTHLARVRHRVIHAGLEPSYGEARCALEALKALDNEIADRAATERARSKYPRTAMALLGKEGLERRGAWIKSLQQLAADPTQPNWTTTFGRWADAMQRARTDHPGWAMPPEASRAQLLAVIYRDGTRQWVLHDREAAMAALATVPTLSVEVESRLSAVSQEIEDSRPEGATEAISIAIMETGGDLREGAVWVPQYRLVPGASVMVAGNDLDPPRGEA